MFKEDKRNNQRSSQITSSKDIGGALANGHEPLTRGQPNNIRESPVILYHNNGKQALETQLV